jgi:hypothetical protein
VVTGRSALYLSENIQYKQIGLYNRDEKCVQRGTDWVFKYSSLRFVFKGLIETERIGISFVLLVLETVPNCWTQ